MKIEETKTVNFNPIEIKITIESKEEFSSLLTLLNVPTGISSVYINEEWKDNFSKNNFINTSIIIFNTLLKIYKKC